MRLSTTVRQLLFLCLKFEMLLQQQQQQQQRGKQQQQQQQQQAAAAAAASLLPACCSPIGYWFIHSAIHLFIHSFIHSAAAAAALAAAALAAARHDTSQHSSTAERGFFTERRHPRTHPRERIAAASRLGHALPRPSRRLPPPAPPSSRSTHPTHARLSPPGAMRCHTARTR